MEFTETFYKEFPPEEWEPMKRIFSSSEKLAVFQDLWVKNLNDFEARYKKFVKRMEAVISMEEKFPGTTSFAGLNEKHDAIEAAMTKLMNKYSLFMDLFYEESLHVGTLLEMLKSGKRDENSLDFMKTIAAEGEKLLEQTDDYLSAFKQMFRQIEDAETQARKDFN
ncbi:MAG TPA: hypothetical protein VI757_02600 [Bacteroidia bacterium]|nr:hypothetical protein [Bacteroidia bacterium]